MAHEKQGKDKQNAGDAWRTAPSDIRVDLGSGPLVSGLNLTKEQADRAMASLIARAERAVAKSPRVNHGHHAA